MTARQRVRQKGVAATGSGKEQALVSFYAQLKRDGLTATELARRANVGRAYLTRVLNGHETGANTWKHVLPVLSDAALFHLKQCSAWNNHAAEALAELQAIQRAVALARI